MAGEPQTPHSRLSPRLERDIQRINFYRFCQLLEKSRPGAPALGSTLNPADDPVRFRPHPGMGFPVSELKERWSVTRAIPTRRPRCAPPFSACTASIRRCPPPGWTDIAQRQRRA